MKKRILTLLSLLLVAALVFSFAGCSIDKDDKDDKKDEDSSAVDTDDDKDEDEDNKDKDEDEDHTHDEDEDAVVPDEDEDTDNDEELTFDEASYEVAITGARTAKDTEGNDVVIVQFTFTNGSPDVVAFATTFQYRAYQNGKELEEASVLEDSANYSIFYQWTEIAPDATVEVEVAYVLADASEEVEVQIEELFDIHGDTRITKMVSIG